MRSAVPLVAVQALGSAFAMWRLRLVGKSQRLGGVRRLRAAAVSTANATSRAAGGFSCKQSSRWFCIGYAVRRRTEGAPAMPHVRGSHL
jgi:hypothetical protein